MNDAVPVIAGLAVGIAFVALFASFFSSAEIVTGQHIDVSIEGLKTEYAIGEQITYTVKANGYGVLSDAYPYAKIINTDTNDMTNEMLYDFVVMWDEPNDAPRTIDAEWPVAERYNDIILYESGNYKLIVELGDETLERQFRVS